MGLIIETRNNSLHVAGSVYPYGYNATATNNVDSVSLLDNNSNEYVFINVDYSDLKNTEGNAFATSAADAASKINTYLGSSNPDGNIFTTDKITALAAVEQFTTADGNKVLLASPTADGGVITKPLQSLLADDTEATSIVFDLENPDSLIDGRLAYDIDRETLVFQSVNGELALGEIYKPVINNTPNDIPAGSVVKASGVNGERFSIENFNAAVGSDEELTLIGVTQKQVDANGGEGLVVTQGVVKHLNTSGWPVGTILYANPAVRGGLISSAPSSPNLAIPVAMVTKQNATNGTIFVRPTIYNHLGEVHDVLISSPSDGQLLTYNSVLGVWQNAFVSVSVNGEPADVTGDIAVDTTLIPEGDNLYYTEVRVSANTNVAANTAKLAGIEAGAEVNVNSDWNATSGDAQILNKPTIPNDISELGGSTDDVSEGQTNLYYTDTRVQAYLTAEKISASYPTSTLNGNTALTSIHEQKMLVCDNGAGMTLQINTGMSRDAEILVYQAGAGGVTISAGSGVTINNTSPFLNITAEQYAIIGLKKLGTSEVWVVTGERKLA
jgi:hypothetical protein